MANLTGRDAKYLGELALGPTKLFSRLFYAGSEKLDFDFVKYRLRHFVFYPTRAKPARKPCGDASPIRVVSTDARRSFNLCSYLTGVGR